MKEGIEIKPNIYIPTERRTNKNMFKKCNFSQTQKNGIKIKTVNKNPKDV